MRFGQNSEGIFVKKYRGSTRYTLLGWHYTCSLIIYFMTAFSTSLFGLILTTNSLFSSAYCEIIFCQIKWWMTLHVFTHHPLHDCIQYFTFWSLLTTNFLSDKITNNKLCVDDYSLFVNWLHQTAIFDQKNCFVFYLQIVYSELDHSFVWVFCTHSTPFFLHIRVGCTK